MAKMGAHSCPRGPSCKNVFIQLLHDLQHQVETFHERIYRHPEHSVRSSPILSPEYVSVRIRAGGSRHRSRDDTKGSADERRQFLVDLKGLEGNRGQSWRGEGGLDDTEGGLGNAMPGYQHLSVP